MDIAPVSTVGKDNLHYIWIGPAPDNKEYIGQDTIGPDLLCDKYPGLTIYFWCLEEYKPFYDTYFFDKPIRVMGIESFIKDKRPPAGLLDLISTLENAAKHRIDTVNAARDRVSIKELIQYYLQQYFAGFFMDSNIIPSPRQWEWLEVPKTDKLTIPYLSSYDATDAWLMYSPIYERDTENRFYYFFRRLEEVITKQGYLEQPVSREEEGSLFIETIDSFDSRAIVVEENTNAGWADFLSLQKRYHNSHRSDKTNANTNPILIRLMNDLDSEDEFRYYLEKKGVNPARAFASKHKQIEDTSLLHLAIERKLLGKLVALLDYIKVPKTLLTAPIEQKAMMSVFDYALNQMDKSALSMIIYTTLNIHGLTDEAFLSLVQHVRQQLIYIRRQEPIKKTKLDKAMAEYKQNRYRCTLSFSKLTESLLARDYDYINAVKIIMKLGPINLKTRQFYVRDITRTLPRSTYRSQRYGDIHYLWMGPPPVLDEYIGQDTIGPDLLEEKYPDLKIYFWCMKEHIDYYENHFKTSNVIVRAIEPYIKLKTANNELLGLIKTISISAKNALNSVEKARALVSIKELMQYYLQQYFHGFFMDTNVIPSPRQDEWVEVPDPTKFYLPKVTHDLVDGWLMYSPKDNPKAQKCFEFYFDSLKEIVERREETPDDISKHNESVLFMATIFNCANFKTIAIQWSESLNTFDFLSLQKRYHNSHHDTDTYTRNVPILLRLIKDKNARMELDYYLGRRKISSTTAVCVLNEASNLSTTLIHQSIEASNMPALEVLLEKLHAPSMLFTAPINCRLLPSPLQYAIKIQERSAIVLILRRAISLHTIKEKDFLVYIENSVSIMNIKSKSDDFEADPRFHKALSHFSRQPKKMRIPTCSQLVDKLMRNDNKYCRAVNLVIKHGAFNQTSKRGYHDAFLEIYRLSHQTKRLSFFKYRRDTPLPKVKVKRSVSHWI